MLLLTGEGGGWEENTTDHKCGRRGPTAEEPKTSCHGAVDTWEKVVEKASEESCEQEDATSSVQAFGGAHQIKIEEQAHSRFSNRGDID